MTGAGAAGGEGNQAAGSNPAAARLLLDEMFSAQIAVALRDLGHDVIAVAERGELRAKSDEKLFAWAATQVRWLATENVKDFRPVQLQALQAGAAAAGVLFTSSRAFPRSRKNPGPLIQSLHSWLRDGPPASPLTEDWLLSPGTG